MLGVFSFLKTLLFRKNKIRVAGGVLILVFLLSIVLSAAFVPNVAATGVRKPELKLYGIVTKDIVNMSNVYTYIDQNGNNRTLHWEVNSDENITIKIGDILFKDTFLNSSTQGDVVLSHGTNAKWQYLCDSNGIPYILGEVHNDTSGEETFYASLVDTVDITFSSDDYIIIVAKVIDYKASYAQIETKLRFVDMGGEDHILNIFIENRTGSDSISLTDSSVPFGSDGKSDDVIFTTYNKPILSDFYIICFNVNNIFERAGLSTEIVKCTAVVYLTVGGVSTSYADNYVKVAFKMLTIRNSIPKINDIELNDTTSISFKATSKITSNYDIVRIANAKIPFMYYPSADKIPDDKELTIKYSWDIVLPDDDALSFSNLELNYTHGSGNITEFWVQGTDKTDSYKSLKEGDEVTLLTSLTPGTLYNIKVKIAYTEDQYDALITEKVAFVIWKPETWPVAFWGLIATILSAFGITVKWVRAKKREAATKAFSKK